mmetsp:Transcript_13719/g.28042  ORF Transcript_13719/g.28042 Transcript_13719/m.28042 type:complete len:207 (+) Transcript_13719:1345-1965(+)
MNLSMSATTRTRTFLMRLQRRISAKTFHQSTTRQAQGGISRCTRRRGSQGMVGAAFLSRRNLLGTGPTRQQTRTWAYNSPSSLVEFARPTILYSWSSLGASYLPRPRQGWQFPENFTRERCRVRVRALILLETLTCLTWIGFSLEERRLSSRRTQDPSSRGRPPRPLTRLPIKTAFPLVRQALPRPWSAGSLASWSTTRAVMGSTF